MVMSSGLIMKRDMALLIMRKMKIYLFIILQLDKMVIKHCLKVKELILI